MKDIYGYVLYNISFWRGKLSINIYTDRLLHYYIYTLLLSLPLRSIQSSCWTITHKALWQDPGRSGAPWACVAHCGGLRCAPRARAVGPSLQTPGTMAGSYLSLRAMGGTVEVGLPGRQGLPCALSKDLLTDDVYCLCWGAASGGSCTTAGRRGWMMAPSSG